MSLSTSAIRERLIKCSATTAASVSLHVYPNVGPFAKGRCVLIAIVECPMLIEMADNAAPWAGLRGKCPIAVELYDGGIFFRAKHIEA